GCFTKKAIGFFVIGGRENGFIYAVIKVGNMVQGRSPGKFVFLFKCDGQRFKLHFYRCPVISRLMVNDAHSTVNSAHCTAIPRRLAKEFFQKMQVFFGALGLGKLIVIQQLLLQALSEENKTRQKKQDGGKTNPQNYGKTKNQALFR